MKLTISGTNVDITKGLKEAADDKFAKLDRYFSDDTEATVVLNVEKDMQKVEATIPMKGHIIRAEQASTDMYVTLDMVVDVIEAQLKKYRQKLVTKQQNAESLRQDFVEEVDTDDSEIKIIKSKKYGFKPMFPEDACVQMELLGHSFYVFSNAETDQVNVVYKRKDGNFGLIEPEF